MSRWTHAAMAEAEREDESRTRQADLEAAYAAREREQAEDDAWWAMMLARAESEA